MYSYWKIKPSQEAVTGSVVYVKIEKGVKPPTKASQKAVRVPSSAYSRYVNQLIDYPHDYSNEFSMPNTNLLLESTGFSDANPF